MKQNILRALPLILVVTFAAVAPAAAQEQPPRFQTTVDVTSLLEVTVVDGSGQPITGLGRGDFNVKIDGQERRVLSAEWVPVVENARSLAGSVTVPDGYSSNENTGGGRLIVIAVDQVNINFGGSTGMMKSLEGFIDKLLPSDRIAVVEFGPGARPLTFISDFDRAKQVVTRLTGNKQPGAPTTYNVGLGESLSIVRGELGMLDGAIARECANMAPRTYQYSVCSTGVKDDAGQIAREALEQANTTITGLVDLLTNLRTIDAPKTLVLISEGFVVDDTQAFATQMGQLAAAARTNLYVLHINETSFDSNTGRRPPSAIEDRRIGVVGLEALANAAGGYMFTINGAGAAVFERLQAELSGYYQVGIQPDARDRDGKPHPIRIDVPWNGAVVRSRRQLLNAGPAVDRRSPQDVVTAGLVSPLPMSALPLRVATFALQGSEPNKVQLLIHAAVGNAYTAAKRVSLGYVILDQNGQEVEGRRLDSRLAPVMNGVPSAVQFVASASLAPGDYTLKLAAADGERSGNVEHRVHARLSENGAVKLSELMAGGPTSVRELLSPTIGYTVTFGSVHGYLEAYGDQAEAVTVKYEIGAGVTTPALVAADVPGRLFGDDRMIFSLVIPVQQLPPGRYVLRARVSLATRPLKTLTRPFEVAVPAAFTASLDGASPTSDIDGSLYLPVDDQVFVRPFQRDEALKADVVSLFRDRLAAPAQAAFDAGLVSLTAGDYRKAEASIKSGIGPDIDSTSLLVYLGVVAAASGDDAVAVGAWQTALFGGGDIPLLYAWLSQGQLRRHSLPEAQEILEEAHEKWPSDPRFAGSLASVYATFGKGKEAALLLEQYLDKSPDDVEAAAIGVEWLYQIRAAGRVVHSGAEDLALARAWAARYGNGPRQALVKQWLDVLERESR
jgi:VWFA-related protein